MELDALFNLGLVPDGFRHWQSGAWVMALGLMRYGFVSGLPGLCPGYPSRCRRASARKTGLCNGKFGHANVAICAAAPSCSSAVVGWQRFLLTVKPGPFFFLDVYWL